VDEVQQDLQRRQLRARRPRRHRDRRLCLPPSA
jgi:hypothetical protein